MSVSVDGTARYVWPVSTGRPGYDTPNGIFKANRMDADHLSQEWENAPMPQTIFFDVRGHAVHGFFDVKHLGRFAWLRTAFSGPCSDAVRPGEGRRDEPNDPARSAVEYAVGADEGAL